MIKLKDPLISGPLAHPQVWITMAWLDVIQSYRRSLLGPMWITLNMAVFSLAMTIVYGAIFGIPSKEYSAYIITGMIGWTWVAALLVEVGNTFITFGNYIKGTVIDKAQMIWAIAFKQVIVMVHNLIVFVLAAAVGIIHVDYYTLLFFPSALLFFLVSVPLSGCLSILFARYRDLPRLVTSLMVVIMLMTPVFWKPTMVTGWRQAVVQLNPIFYAIEFLRRPLLGEPPDPVALGVFLALAAFVWFFGRLFFKRYVRYVAYWI
jgi:ABC-type polysaccharide/polyol phosphate export permease